MATGATCPHCGSAGTRALPAVRATGARVARTSTTTLAGGLLAVRSRSATASSSLLAVQLRPPAHPRSASRPAAVAAACAGIVVFISYGLLAAPSPSAQDSAAGMFAAAVLAAVGGAAGLLAAVRRHRAQGSRAVTERAMWVWRSGTWCGSCHHVALPVPGAGRQVIVSAEHAYQAVHDLARVDAGGAPRLAT